MTTEHTMYRTHHCGAIGLAHVGHTVRLSGWINTLRAFKRQSFVELREHSGLIQLVVPSALAQGLTEESVLCVVGEVRPRLQAHPQAGVGYPTGHVEVHVVSLEVLGAAGPLPFAQHEEPGEQALLRHRTMALRRPGVRQRLEERAAVVRAMRGVAEAEGFLEVETPVLVRNTPGGAAPFVVPVGEGLGYALAQSPQVWKQLLVCGGVERYHQLAHCFRNEGARPERQPEFSQFEIEMAFGSSEEVMGVMERMVHAAAAAVACPVAEHFPVFSYLEALAQFGSEKPHLGNPLRLTGPVATAQTRYGQGRVELVLPQRMTREEERTWLAEVWRGVGENGCVELTGQTIVATGPLETVQLALGRLITAIGAAWGLISPGVFPVWVHTFPLFERSEQGVLQSAHHPFTRPVAGMEEWVTTAPERVLGVAFDLAINGVEVGGGSMRIHEPHLQREVFGVLGMENSAEHFRPLLEALELGAPPHGGMALGVERLVASLVGAVHIREVMAFPKTTGGQCLFTQALGPV